MASENGAMKAADRHIEAAGRAMCALENERDREAFKAGITGDRAPTDSIYGEWTEQFNEEGRTAVAAWLDSLLGDIPEEAVGCAGAALREKYKPRLGIVARAVVYRHPSTEQISEDAIRPFLQSLRSSLGGSLPEGPRASASEPINQTRSLGDTGG